MATGGEAPRCDSGTPPTCGGADAKQLRILLAAALDMAITQGVLHNYPARAAKPPPKPRKHKGRGATPIPKAVLPAVIQALTESQKCREKDLTDPILIHLATGLRVSEVLGLMWEDLDVAAQTIAVSGLTCSRFPGHRG